MKPHSKAVEGRRIIIVGGGAAGFFAAITCAEAAPHCEVILLEKGPQFLSKVRISGGGRCNVTHACFDARELTKRFPRGERALIAPFHRFQASDTVAWFEARGVTLKVESDGRMFPTTDSSQTIIDCLLGRARAAGVKLFTNRGVNRVVKTNTLGDAPSGGSGKSTSHEGPPEGRTPSSFELTLSNGETMTCDRLLLAIGGCRTPALGELAVSMGHTLEPPVPSLFTFHIETPWLRALAGVSVEAEVSVPGAGLRERGPVLATHWGLGGPTVLRLSAWGARTLHKMNYHFPLLVNWLPSAAPNFVAPATKFGKGLMLDQELGQRRETQSAKLVINTPLAPLPARLWEALVLAAGIARDTRWSALSSGARHRLAQQLLRTELPVTGKSLNKDEFVTCGGVRLKEVDFKTMGSRICPGLYFAGEVLDIDGITGGFNFQSAWTTGWIAGRAMAGTAT